MVMQFPDHDAASASGKHWHAQFCRQASRCRGTQASPLTGEMQSMPYGVTGYPYTPEA